MTLTSMVRAFEQDKTRRAKDQQAVAIEQMRRDEARMKNESEDALLCGCGGKEAHACEGCDEKGGGDNFPSLPTFERMGEPDWLRKQRVNMSAHKITYEVGGTPVVNYSDRDEIEASEKGGGVIVAALAVCFLVAIATLLAWGFYDVLERLIG